MAMNSPDRGHEAPATTENQNGVWMTERGQMMSSRDHIISLLGGGEHAQGGNVGPDGHEPGVPSENIPVKP